MRSKSHDDKGDAATPIVVMTFRAGRCIDRLYAVHRSYLSGFLTDEQCWHIEEHLLSCRRCENHWDALSSEMEDSFPHELRDAEEAGVGDAETEGDFVAV